MVTIANAIYDSVFKYLMQDTKAASVLLGALLGTKIVDLKMKNNEYAVKVKNRLDVLRIDFSATILDNNGEKKLITIELQNAYLKSEVMRFRKYLAEQYKDKNNFVEKDGRKVPIPIVTIYILGHPCCDKEVPVIYGNPEFYDPEHQKLGDLSNSDFINGLIHNLIIVQVPYLKLNAKNKVEKYLDFLNQLHKIDKTKKNAHLLRVDDENIDEDYNLIVRRLEQACADEEVRKTMEVEDELNEDIESWNATELKLREQLQEKDSQLQEKASQLQEKDSQLQEKDSQLQQQSARIAKSIQKMYSLGVNIEEIATDFDVDVEFVKGIVKTQ